MTYLIAARMAGFEQIQLTFVALQSFGITAQRAVGFRDQPEHRCLDERFLAELFIGRSGGRIQHVGNGDVAAAMFGIRSFQKVLKEFAATRCDLVGECSALVLQYGVGSSACQSDDNEARRSHQCDVTLNKSRQSIGRFIGQ